ncbi:MAG: NINE protein, partial [Pseudomonadaceae bacterium]
KATFTEPGKCLGNPGRFRVLSNSSNSTDLWACDSCGAVQAKVKKKLEEIETILAKQADPAGQRRYIGLLESVYKDADSSQLERVKVRLVGLSNVHNLFDELIARRKLLSSGVRLPAGASFDDISAVGNASGASASSDKKMASAFLLCFFFGVFGLHRFYVGKNKTALLQFLVAGGGALPLLAIAFFLSPQVFSALLGVVMILIIPVAIWIFVDLVMILFGKFTDGTGACLDKW